MASFPVDTNRAAYKQGCSVTRLFPGPISSAILEMAARFALMAMTPGCARSSEQSGGRAQERGW